MDMFMIARKHKHKRRLFSFWLLCLLGAIILILDVTTEFQFLKDDTKSHVVNHNLYDSNTKYKTRDLLSVKLENCTPPAIEQFPYPLMSKQARKDGGIVLHIFLGAYMFLALAIACDEYFVPACEKICDALNLQSDVAGATFMAAGSSAPELATSVIGVFIAKDDIGLGAVVGSAVFNIMFVISICALFAGTVVYLNWWPMFRDSLFYTISIIALVITILDERVQWYEALVLLVLYLVYILIMFLNPYLEAFFTSRFSCCGYNKTEDSEKTELTPVNGKSHSPVTHSTFDMTGESDSENTVEESTEFHSLLHNETPNGNAQHMQLNGNHKEPAVVVKTHLEEDEEESPFSIPEGCCKRFLWVISLPLLVVMFITVPDCRKQRWKKFWLITFIMSCVWIAVFSYLMVWMITIVGYMAHIPDSIMALTFLAAGTSVPDLISSLLVSRDGYGDMAISNAIGSNVFDILLCLGLPYFLKSVIVNGGAPIEVYSAGLTYSSVTLLTTVVFLLVSMHINGWKLDIKYGIILMVVYVLFNILAILYELNVFGYFHPPECPSVM